MLVLRTHSTLDHHGSSITGISVRNDGNAAVQRSNHGCVAHHVIGSHETEVWHAQSRYCCSCAGLPLAGSRSAHHVERVKALLETDAGSKAIIDTWGNDCAFGEELAKLGCGGSGHCEGSLKLSLLVMSMRCG